MTEKNLENIFKESLSNYQADVNPSLWQSVQSGLVSKSAAVSGTSGTTQAGVTVAGLGVKGILWVASAVLISGAGLFFALTGKHQSLRMMLLFSGGSRYPEACRATRKCAS